MIFPGSSHEATRPLPSARECLDRLAAMADTPKLIHTLRGGPGCMPAAAERLHELYTLADQLARNLRGGYGVPVTPGLKPQVMREAAATAATSGADATAPAVPAAPAPSVHRARSAQPDTPPGHLTSDEILVRLDRSRSWLDKEIRERRFPAAAQRKGLRLYWTAESIDTYAATLPAKHSRAGRP